MRTMRYGFVSMVVLMMACGRPPESDTRLILRQRSLGTTLALAVGDAEIDVSVTAKTKTVERMVVPISPEQVAEVRRLFWEAFRHPPTQRLTPVRDLVFEQEWRGRARSYEITIQGPLTSHDYRAYDYLNGLVPPRYRLLVDFGPQRRSK